MIIPLVELLSSVGEMVAAAGAADVYLPTPKPEQASQMMDYSMFLIIVTSAFLAVSLGRDIDLNPYDLHRLIVVFTASIATYYAIPAMS